MIWHVAFSFCWSLLIFLQFDRLVESGVWAVSGSHPRSDFVSVVAGWNTGPLRPEEVRADSESCFGCSSVQRQCCKLFGRLLDPPVWRCGDTWADRVVTLVRLERKATPEASEVPNSRLKRSID